MKWVLFGPNKVFVFSIEFERKVRQTLVGDSCSLDDIGLMPQSALHQGEARAMTRTCKSSYVVSSDTSAAACTMYNT